MKIQESKEGKVAVLTVSGRLTLGDGDDALREACDGLVERGERRIVIDLTKVPYMDSAGLGELMACSRRARDAGAQIRLVLNPKTKELLVVGAVIRAFEVHDDLVSALNAF